NALAERVGKAAGPDYTSPRAALIEAGTQVGRYVTPRPAPAATAAGGAGAGAGGAKVGDAATAATAAQSPSVASAAAPGEIRSPQDVVAALDRICFYYDRNEPSSPVPLLLQCARRLVS